MSVTVPLAYPAAIPAGHRVELTWLLKRGGFRDTPKPRPYEPFLRDLDTGIGHGTDWQLGNSGTFHSSRVNEYAIEPLAALEVVRTLRGRVLTCTIVTVTLPEPYQQTLLVIDEE